MPIFNKKFEISARGSSDFHRPVDQGLNLDEILSVQTEFFLHNDRTLVHDKQWYQVLTKTRAQRVILHEDLDGHVGISHAKPKLEFKRAVSRFRVRGITSPVKNHWWRRDWPIKSKTGHF